MRVIVSDHVGAAEGDQVRRRYYGAGVLVSVALSTFMLRGGWYGRHPWSWVAIGVFHAVIAATGVGLIVASRSIMKKRLLDAVHAASIDSWVAVLHTTLDTVRPFADQPPPADWAKRGIADYGDSPTNCLIVINGDVAKLVFPQLPRWVRPREIDICEVDEVRISLDEDGAPEYLALTKGIHDLTFKLQDPRPPSPPAGMQHPP